MGRLIALAFWIFAIWLIRRDTALRKGISSALWIPTIWAFILLSRPITMWVGFGAGSDSLEGSPLDRLFYFAIIFLALHTLSKRNVNWSLMLSKNWPIFLFYGYFLVSVLWADSPISSFKRWFKDLGNVFVAAVILTEVNPMEAFRAVFVRCAYILIPLSEIYIRYLPEQGRHYSRSGGLEITGVTTQKNSLGIMALICCLVLIWDWFERLRPGAKRMKRFDRYLPVVILLFGAYLMHLSDSKTSMVCMALGTVVLLSIKLPFLRKRVGALGGYTMGAFGSFFLLDWLVGGVKEMVVGGLGRDMTFTGRTDVWHDLLELHTDPIIGTGFCSIWSDERYLSQLPLVAGSAHNGYLETYLDGGVLGLVVLGVLLLAMGWRVNRQLRTLEDYSLIRFTILLAIIVGSFSESHFGRMGPLWFVFILTSLTIPTGRRRAFGAGPQSSSPVAAPAQSASATVPVFSPLPS